MERGGGAKIVFYEVWTPLADHNFYFDISDLMADKLKLIRMYPSQIVDGWDYDRWARGLNEYRSMYVRPGKYAEVYAVRSLKHYLQG
ncbi:hypothetical protein FACS1894139_15960 [Planctomycetales bacterium]|nr:hypothetical protein FACS1894107_13330 [Planctomycetales bacterium]GHT00422.1 hypothetical protein FACS1894108_12440 [Planctomycetales bacterium]GHT07520.1 hypothetical protein FACS1894139_15960 [Planctomycetales bacterium]